VTPDEIETNLKEPDDDAEFLGREEADRVARSREEPRNVTPPEPERIDPATIPGVQRGMPKQDRTLASDRFRATDDPDTVVDTQTGEVITRDDLRRALHSVPDEPKPVTIPGERIAPKPVNAPWTADEIRDIE
jgi:hypothetical protein